MNTKMIAIVAVAAVVIIIAGAFFAMNTGSLGGEENSIVDYSVKAGDSSPVLTIKFSKPLEYPASVKLLNSSYRQIGVWISQSSHPGNVVEIDKIALPNLIGKYYVVLLHGDNVVMNKTIKFQGPDFNVVNVDVQKDVKGDTAYIEYVELTIQNSGDSPYYYNRIRWEMEDLSGNEKIPLQCISTESNGMVKINIAKYVSTGEHRLVVHFDYFDFTTITINVNVDA